MPGDKIIWTKEDDNKVIELYLNGKKFYEISKELNRKQRFIRNCIENAAISEVGDGNQQLETVLAKYRMTNQHYTKAVQRRQRNEQNKLEREEIKNMSKEDRKELYKQKRQSRSEKKSQHLLDQFPSDLTVQELAISVANLVNRLNNSGIKCRLQIRGTTVNTSGKDRVVDNNRA